MTQTEGCLPRETNLKSHLQEQYGSRWDVLVDALFQSAPAQRASLLSPFMHHKEHKEVLRSRNIMIHELVDQVPDAFYRHVSTGLLNAYWCYPAALVPVLFVNPRPNCRVLVLGNCPPSRLLGLCYLVLGEAASDDMESPAKRSTGNSSGGPASVAGSGGSNGGQPPQNPQAETMRSPRAMYWSIYGEGDRPPSWEKSDKHKIRNGAPPPMYVPWPLKMLDAILCKTVRAGCCMVRTTSGDWSEKFAEKMEAESSPPSSSVKKETGPTYDARLSNPNACLRVLHSRPDYEEEASQWIESHLPIHLHSQIRLEKADDIEDDRSDNDKAAAKAMEQKSHESSAVSHPAEIELSQTRTTSDKAQSSQTDQADVAVDSSGASLESAKVRELESSGGTQIGNDPRASPERGESAVPSDMQTEDDHATTSTQSRDENGSSDENSSKLSKIAQPETLNTAAVESARQGGMDLVIVEADCSANESNVREACQTGSKAPWPDSQAQDRMREQRTKLLDGFKKLRVGGKLLYCCNSLAQQETDDVILDCSPTMLRSLRVLKTEDLEEDPLTKELLVTAKKFGLERTKYGWRMLPDLAFQNTQYFSILQRIS